MQPAASSCLANVGQVQIHVLVRNASTCTNSLSLLSFESQFLWYLLTLAAHLFFKPLVVQCKGIRIASQQETVQFAIPFLS